jgi:tRNA(Ile)-lysidine synthase
LASQHKVTVILGLSGGPDSVYLLHTLAALHHDNKISLIAAHLDHQWRPDSSQDALLCEQLSQRYKVPCIIQRAPHLGLTQQKHESLEVFGRRLRRTFFENLAAEYQATYIALAHHADDQAETFLIRLLRGTTITGLTCMKEVDGIYWRPLLSKRKQELLDFLNKNDINYVTDSTNQSDAFLRNALRSNVIPVLEKVDTRWNKQVHTTIARLSEAELFLEKVTDTAYAHVITRTDNDTMLDAHAFKAQDVYLQKRIVLRWLIDNKASCNQHVSERFLDEIIRFLTSKRGGTHRLTRTWYIHKQKGIARIKHT